MSSSVISTTKRITAVVFACAICSNAWTVSQTPDNAALLYYQAFLLRGEADGQQRAAIDSFWRGGGPDDIAQEYPVTSRTVEIAESATKVKSCIWGLGNRIEQGDRLQAIVGNLRQIGSLIEMDARAYALLGDYSTALDRCLTVLRLAPHICNEGTVGYLAAMTFRGQAFRCIQATLGADVEDIDKLLWLQGQLGSVEGPQPPPGHAMETTLEDAVEFYRTNLGLVATWKENILSQIEDDDLKKNVSMWTEAEIVEQARHAYSMYLASAHRVIASEMSYQQKYAELMEAAEDLMHRKAAGEPVGVLRAMDLDVPILYNMYVTSVANFTVVRAALEVYLLGLQTGSLPEALPLGAPKDPFSGEDFEYRITSEGFSLRCRGRDIAQDKVWEYGFVW